MNFKFFFIALFLGISWSSCENTTVTPDDKEILKSNTWVVSYFWDKDQDETSDFNGYAFAFGENNVFTASKGGDTFTGTWSVGIDDSRNKLVINITGNSVLDEINEDWTVISISADKVELEDDNGVDEEILHFQKQ